MAELAFKEQDPQETLVQSVEDPRVAGAGVFLIGQHRLGKPVKLEALGRPQDALVSLSEQLETLGTSHEMKVEFIEALRRYLVARGAEFSRAASAKPVYLSLEVAEGLPDCRFENSLTEVTCIGTEGIKVQGVSGQNVRATISGTATTSNAADVDAMFANVQGLRLWFRCEAPTKEDLDGLMTAMELALAGVAQAVGGSMSAEGFKALLETLEAEGALTPQMENLIASMIALQKAEELGLGKAEIGELIQTISTLIAEGQANGLIPASFIEAATKALGELASNDVMRDFLIENGFEDLVASNDNILSVEDRIAELMDQLDALQSVDGLDPTLTAELQEMVETLKEQLVQENADPASILESMSEKLMDMASREDLPQALFDGIGDMLPEIAVLKQEISEAEMSAPDLSNPETMLAMLEDIAAKIEAGELDLNEVPSELIEVIENLGGVEALTQEQDREARLDAVAAAIDSPEGSDMGIAMAAAIEMLSDPAMVEQLPPAMQESVQSAMEMATMENTANDLPDNAATQEQADMKDDSDIISAVNLTETFANPELVSPTAPALDTSARPSPIATAYGVGGGVSPTGFSGGESGGGYIAPTVAPTVVTVVTPPQSSPTESVAPDTKNNAAEPEKKKDVAVVVLPDGKLQSPPPKKDALEKDAPAEPPVKPDAPETSSPEQATNDSGTGAAKGKGPCGDVCDCDTTGDFNKATKVKEQTLENAPKEIIVTPEVQEIVKNLPSDVVKLHGGSEAVERIIQQVANNDPQALKDKTVEDVLVQMQKKERVWEAIKDDRTENPIDNEDRDERKRQEMIARRDKKEDKGPIPRLKDAHDHACGPGCKHDAKPEEIGVQSDEQAAVFAGKGRSRRGSTSSPVPTLKTL